MFPTYLPKVPTLQSTSLPKGPIENDWNTYHSLWLLSHGDSCRRPQNSEATIEDLYYSSAFYHHSHEYSNKSWGKGGRGGGDAAALTIA